MSKKAKSAKQTDGHEEQKKSNNTFYVVLAVALILAVAGGFLYGRRDRTSALKPAGNIERGGETRPTLSPALFFGKTSNAYKAAQDIPEVLDSLFCYCYCKPNFGHKSLLTCFTDDHGANCDICINEAIRAGELHKAGKTIPEIRAAIDKEFYRP